MKIRQSTSAATAALLTSRRRTGALLLAIVGLSLPVAAQAQFTGIDDAAPVAFTLGGTTKYDGWYNFSNSTKEKIVNGQSYVIPGRTGYPTALSSAPRWNIGMASQLQSNSAQQAIINKVSNSNGSGYAIGYDSFGIPNALNHFDAAGSPLPGSTWLRANGTAGADGFGYIPSGESLYAISFSNVTNARFGTLGLFEANPVEDLKNVVLQIEMGGANGYDFWNHSLGGPTNTLPIGGLDPSQYFPQMRLTLGDSSTVTLTADYAELLEKGFNGTIEMPTGPGGELEEQPIYINLYAFQWDLSDYEDIESYNITWTAVEHTQTYAVRADQSDTYSQVVNVPEPSTFVAALYGVAALATRRFRRSTGSTPAAL